tara:strand:+ start:2267 stop:2653 length:387 start_codon:yes stop_codon:yes gene_type:complete
MELEMPKVKKTNKKRSSNVILLKKDLVQSESTEHLLSIEEQERERTNKFARKICDEIDNYVKECKMDTDMTYYHFLFHLKQRLIHRVSYNLFKFADKSSTDEVTENMAKYLNENSPELKLDSINNTIQ